jgi:hypothetical protein
MMSRATLVSTLLIKYNIEPLYLKADKIETIYHANYSMHLVHLLRS